MKLSGGYSMRRFIGGLVIAGFMIFGGADQVMAQKTIAGRELNQRIQALRDKLHNYQSRNVKVDTSAGDDAAGLILEQPEVKGEKIVEELESRKDVAVTVLFHDSETTPAIDDNLESAAVAVSETKVANSAVAKPYEDRQVAVPAQTVMLVSTQASNSYDSRTKRYEELRQRVYQATRTARIRAASIGRQIARMQ
mgnify:CR=1 FL=1